jgi:hypothetical protein
MRKLWGLGAIVALVVAIGCSGSGGGTPGDGGCCGTTDGGPPDGGCTGPACATDGGTDGGTATGLTATPDRVVIGTTTGTAKSEQVTLQNTSASPVSLQSLPLSGDGAGAFQVSGGGTLPADLAPGASTTLTVTFNGAAGVSKAMLSAVTAAGTTKVPLGGLGLAAGTEPSLQWIFDVHNIPVNAGNPDPTKKDLPPVPIAGDEILVQSFVKAGDGPVTLQLIGSFGPSSEPVSINGWYPTGNGTARNTLFSIAQADAQVLDPAIENGGTLSFDPGSTAFGFWNQWPFWYQQVGSQYVIYQEDALNTWDTKPGGVQHHMRVYPYRNPDGSRDPHAYIVTTEETFIAYGPDYNDVVYIVRNVVPAGSGGGALQFLNQDGEPSNDRMVFSVITTIAGCWGPLNVKDSGTLRVQNLSGGTVTVSSVDVADAFTVTPSTPFPASLAPGASLDLAVKFVATDGRVHNGSLTVHSDDPNAATRTIALAGFRQDVPQNTYFPQTSTEPDLDEVVNSVYGYGTVVGTKQQLIDVGEDRVPVGDEVISSYWVKADSTRPVTARLMSAFHSGWDCGNPTDVSYGSWAYWFPKGRTSNNDDSLILNGAKDDIQRMLPQNYDGNGPAAGSFDPTDKQFGFHIEAEFSDESLLGPLDIVPNCTAQQGCGHRMRFWPLKDASGTVVPNAWIVSVDMHRPATPGHPENFFSNYDYNDETYLFENVMPAPP